MKTDDLSRDSFDASELQMHFPARIIPADERAALPALVSLSAQSVTLASDDATLRRVIVESGHVQDPSILDEHAPYFWPAEISSARRDSYDTKMDPETTLKNYVEDAIAGVSFCNSHDHDELAFGRSFAAVSYETPDEDQDGALVPAVAAAFYTLAGLQTNRVTTDNLIKSIRGGLSKDVSVGFKPGVGFEYRCSICNRDIWDWDCDHVPGVTYDVKDDTTGETVKRYAIAWVCNARLSEVSSVFDGSTPSAMILKAQRMALAGRIPQRVALFVERMCRTQLPGKRPFLLGSDKERSMAGENEKGDKGEELSRVRASITRLDEHARKVAKGLGIEVKDDASAEVVIESLRASVTDLKPKAERGDKLFEVLVKSTLEEGTRAKGADKFDEAKWRKTLERLEPEDIENFRSEWADEAKNKLGAGGRKSKDEGERDPAESDDDESSETERSANVVGDDFFNV